MRSALRVLTSLAGCCLLAGCATVPARVTSYGPPLPPRGIVLVADGAGGNEETTRALAAAVKESGAPLYVRAFEWTHGQKRGVLDMTDVAHAQAQGRDLARQIAWYRQTYPDTPISLLAYSAGAHVALEATRWLEPDSLERIVLLAPSVAADYDLRQPLGAARQGIDVFTSKRDRLFLGLGTRVVGTADGKYGVPAAGRVGFDAPILDGTSGDLAQRLRQHPWEQSLTWTGNMGTHSGSLNPAYFRAYILPLFGVEVPVLPRN